MGKIVNDVCSALLNIIMNICLQIIDLTMALITGVGVNTNILDSLASSVTKTLYTDVFIPLGWGIALLLLMTGIFQFMFPFLNKNSLPADNVLFLFVRFGISIVLIFILKALINSYITPLISETFNYIGDIETDKAQLLSSFTSNIDLNDSSNNSAMISSKELAFISIVFSSLEVSVLNNLLGGVLGIAVFIVALVMAVYLSVVCIKFLIYHLETLIQTSILVMSAPLVAGTYTSKQTSNMLFTWLKMILKNFTCLIFNIIVIKLAQAICSDGIINLKVQGGGTANALFLVLLLPILIATLNVGKKMSIYIGQLFNLNGMGDAIRDGVGGVGHTVMSLGGMAMAGGRVIKSDMRQKKTMEMQQSQHKEKMDQSDAQHKDRMDKMDKANAQRAQDIANREAKQAKSDADKDKTNMHNMSPEAREMYENLRNNGSTPENAKNEVKSRGFDSAISGEDWKNLSPKNQDLVDQMANQNNEDFFDAYNEAKKGDLSANDSVEFANSGVKTENLEQFKEAKNAGLSNGDATKIAKGYASTQEKALNKGLNQNQATALANARMENKITSSPISQENAKADTYYQAYNKAISTGKSESTAKSYAEMKTKNM